MNIAKITGVLSMMVVASGCASLGASGEPTDSAPKPVVQRAHSVEESQAQYKLGKYYIAQGRLGLALAAFNRAIEFDPGNVEARNARGIALVRLGDIKGAVLELETAVASSPGMPHLLNNLAYAHMLDGALALAADNLERSLRIDPVNAKARENWNELSRRALANPQLAEKMKQFTLEPVPALDEAATPSIKPQSSIPNQALRHASVLNVSFGSGIATVAEYLLANNTEPPLAVELLASGALPAAPNGSLVAFVGASIGSTAVTEALTEHPAITTFVQSLIPSDTLALRPAMIARKNSDIAAYRRDLAPGELPAKYDLNLVRVEVANGNGVLNMAKELSTELRRNNVRVWRIANAEKLRV